MTAQKPHDLTVHTPIHGDSSHVPMRRYFAEAVGTLLCAVNGKRERRTTKGTKTDYWLSDGAREFPGSPMNPT